MNYVSNINITGLVLLVALPFSPAFAINIACGLSKMPFKNFLIAILIGKLRSFILGLYWYWFCRKYKKSNYFIRTYGDVIIDLYHNIID